MTTPSTIDRQAPVVAHQEISVEAPLETTGDGVHVVTEESFSGPLVEANRDQMQGMLDGSLVSWLGHLNRAAESG